jgi:hypothetical protein
MTRHLVRVLGLLLLFAAPAHATVYTDVTCSEAILDDYFTSGGSVTAVNGDEIICNETDHTWSGNVLINTPNIILRGAGSGLTVLTQGVAGGTMMFIAAPATGVRITGFTLIASTATHIIQAASTGWRIDHNTVTCSSFCTFVMARGTTGGSGVGFPSGLADHNSMTNARFNGQACIDSGTGAPVSSQCMDDNVAPGTEHAVFFEDNTITFTVFGNCIDSNLAARYVFRNNTISGCPESTNTHGIQGDHRGTMISEIYLNNINQNIGNQSSVSTRSGAAMVFLNSFNGTLSGKAMQIDYQRAFEWRGTGATTCNGLSSWDATPATDAAPEWCRDQPGRLKDASLWTSAGPYPAQSKYPVYGFGNTDSTFSANVPFYVRNGVVTTVATDASNSKTQLRITNCQSNSATRPLSGGTRTGYFWVPGDGGPDAFSVVVNGTAYFRRLSTKTAASTNCVVTFSPALPDIPADGAEVRHGSALYIHQNDEYFDYTASFDGTLSCATAPRCGVGMGTRAKRDAAAPANGTTIPALNTAWWSTDAGGNWNTRADAPSANDGCLDVAVVPGAWTNCHYTPYANPHPDNIDNGADVHGAVTIVSPIRQ